MLSRISCFAFLALASAGIGSAVFRGGGDRLENWLASLALVGVAAFASWALVESNDAFNPIGSWADLALLVFPFYLALELIPLPLALVRFVSPSRAALADALGQVTMRPTFVSLSVSPATTLLYSTRAAACIAVFLGVREVARRSRDWWPEWSASLPVIPLVVFGAAESWIRYTQPRGPFESVGTYANRNHFAGLLEMILPLAIGGVAAFLAGQPIRSISVTRALLGSSFAVASLGMFHAIVDSQSKMGFLATLVALATMGWLIFAEGRGRRVKLVVASILVLCALASIIFLPSIESIGQFGGLLARGSVGEGRISIAIDTLRMIAAYPLFGSGLGTYASVFMKYQTSSVGVAFDFAHNDYLQAVSEIGIIGFFLIAALVLPIFRKAWRAATWEADAETHFLGIGWIGAMVAIGLHSFTDFNMYVPSNALVFAWVLGIGAALDTPAEEHERARSAVPMIAIRALNIAFAAFLSVFSAGWFAYQRGSARDAASEARFCGFGICALDSIMADQKAAGVNPLPQAELLEAVRRDPAAANRWSDLGESFDHSGQSDKAKASYVNSIALGPNLPPVLLSAAAFFGEAGDMRRAITLVNRALQSSTSFDAAAFDWLASSKIPVRVIVTNALPASAPIYRSYLQYLTQYTRQSGDRAGTEDIWKTALHRGYLDEETAQGYIGWLARSNDYLEASTALAAYLGSRAADYTSRNWVFNGDFESDFSRYPLDWRISPQAGSRIARDSAIHHSGAYSLRIDFDGTRNLEDPGVTQWIGVSPGQYRFDLFAKSEGLSTDQGVALHLWDVDSSRTFDWTSEAMLGTSDWRDLGTDVCVRPGEKRLGVALLRRPSLKIDSSIKGTLWIDTVSFKRVSESCAR